MDGSMTEETGVLGTNDSPAAGEVAVCYITITIPAPCRDDDAGVDYITLFRARFWTAFDL